MQRDEKARKRKNMTGNIKWLVLAVLVLILFGVLRNARLSPEEKAVRTERREKSTHWEETRKGREN